MLLSTLAFAAPLALRLDAPPTQVSEDRWEFAPGVELRVRPAVVVTLREGDAPPARGEHLGGPFWLVPSAAPVQDALRMVEEGKRAFPDVILPQATMDFDDPLYGGQWYLDSQGMAELYAVSMGSPDIRVAVIDSGIDIAHPDLESAVLSPYDAWADDEDPSPDPGEYCSGGSSAICDEHGTAVSGIVLARANNGEGVVGMCPMCSLVPIKLLGESGGSGTAMSADIRAFEHAIAEDVAVINNSWGFTESIPVPEPLAEVIHRAATEPRGGLGALVVFAAGNDDRVIEDDELGALEDVLCISAVDSYGYPTNYTNTGAAVDVSAPSATVSIAPEGGTTTTFGGTSAAAPVASGLAGWAMSQDPEMSAAELRALLIDTSVDSPYMAVDDEGRNDTFGYGTISPTAVLAALYPAEDTGSPAEDPGGCACDGSGGLPGIFLLPALLIVRRRTC